MSGINGELDSPWCHAIEIKRCIHHIGIDARYSRHYSCEGNVLAQRSMKSVRRASDSFANFHPARNIRRDVSIALPVIGHVLCWPQRVLVCYHDRTLNPAIPLALSIRLGCVTEQKARVSERPRDGRPIPGQGCRGGGGGEREDAREPCRFARCGTGITNWPRLILPVHCQRCIIAGKLPNEPHLHLKGAPITPTAFYFIGIVRVAAPRSNYPRRHPSTPPSSRVAPLFSPDRARSLRFYRLSPPPHLSLSLSHVLSAEQDIHVTIYACISSLSIRR